MLKIIRNTMNCKPRAKFCVSLAHIYIAKRDLKKDFYGFKYKYSGKVAKNLSILISYLILPLSSIKKGSQHRKFVYGTLLAFPIFILLT